MTEQGYEELMEAIFRLRTVFIKNGMKPPTSIELGEQRDSLWFRANLPRDMMMERPRMGDTPSDAKWVCSIMGVDVVMPAQWHSTTGGKMVIDDIDRYIIDRAR